MRIKVLFVFLALAAAPLSLAACADDPAAARDSGPALDRQADQDGVPATVSVSSGKTTLTISTDPLGFTLLHDGKVLSAAAAASASDPWGPAGLGVVKGFNASRFYDPAAPLSEVSWSAALAVTAVQPAGAGTDLTLSNGAKLTASPAPGVSGAVKLELTAAAPDEKNAAVPQVAMSRLCLGVVAKEVFFGFGEVFDAVASRGVVRPMQLLIDSKSDSGLNEVHVPVPLGISPRGWAMLAPDFHAGAFDVASGKSDRICATFTTHKLAMYLMTDPDPLELVERTVSLTARPALPPDWAFAPQQWRNALTHQDELLADAKAMRQHKIPGSVVWIDNPWQTGYNTHLFDTKQFPEAKGTIQALHALGYKVLVWSTPYINSDQTAMHAEASQAGYLVKDPAGKTLVAKWSNGSGSMFDFSAPGAVAYWQKNIKKVIDLGIDGFKLDYGEEGVVAIGAGLNFFRFHGGVAPATMHREYPGLYHNTYLEALPKAQGFLITRAGSLGEQVSNTCIWPGDLDASFETHAEGRVGGLPAAIIAGLSLSASGYPFYGSDIGGYRKGSPTSELLVRWAGYAALGTIMQLGGGGKNHNPWDATRFESWALTHYRTQAQLHLSLFPTIYTLAVEAAATGRPVTRPLGLSFPADEKAWTDPYQFMLGEQVLVAPVVTAGAVTRKVYLPAGTWVHTWTGKPYQGAGEVDVPAPLGQTPLFRPVGSVLALLGRYMDTLAPATDSAVVSYKDHQKELLWDIIPGAAATSTTLFDGAQLQVSPSAGKLTLVFKAGSQFSQFFLLADWKNAAGSPAAPATVTVDGKTLAPAKTFAEVAVCPAGCWYHDAALGMLRLSLPGPGGTVVVQ